MEASRLPRLLRDRGVDGKNAARDQHKSHSKTARQPVLRKETDVAEWKELAVQKGNWRKETRCIKNKTLQLG
jgi:hypothetical protein